ncbi:MAG: hypothetical protein ABI920_10020 [Casimicrobiaceae bacterium]
MTRSPQPLHRVMAADETLAGWQARRRDEEALTALVRRQLPRQLGARVRATVLPSGEVELVSAAGAVAAAVRQRAPDLLLALQAEGWHCSGVRVRVQVSTSTPAPVRPAPRPIDRDALAPMARLARSLPQGPLKAALARFLRRTGGV